MKVWARLRAAQSCGLCGGEIAKGTPALELAGPGWRKLRCVACAGEPAPADVAVQPTTASVIRGQFGQSIASVRGLAKDWKHAQGGDRND